MAEIIKPPPERWHDDDEVYDQSLPWQWRAIRATLGSSTGAVVMAMLAKEPQFGPAFGAWCEITKDGVIETQVRQQDDDGMWRWQKPIPIGTVVQVRDALRRLSQDHCKFNDGEVEALFEEFRKWVRKDHRAKSGTE